MKDRKSFGWIACLLLMAGFPALSSAQSGQLKLTASMDKDSILIGEQVKFTIHASYPSHFNFQFPTFQDTLMKDLEVVSYGPIDTVKYDQSKQWIDAKRDYYLTSFAGQTVFHIPPVAYTVPTPSGMDTLRTKSFVLKVFFPPIDSTFAPHDIYGPIKYPINFAELKPYLLAAHFLIWLAILTYIIARKIRRKEKIFSKPEPPVPPHLKAMEELVKIKREKLWLKASNKVFYTELTDVLRHYLDGQFELSTLEKTSEEIIREVYSIEEKILSQKQKMELADILRQSDLAKFAKIEWGPMENETGLENAIHFVASTQNVLEPVTESKGKEQGNG